MRALEPCTNHYGGRAILAADPAQVRLEDAIYIPNSDVWCGLYDPTGALVPEAGMYRGPERHLVLPQPSLDPLPPRDRRLPGSYFYLGPVHPHFGHFLLSTFSRLWPLVQEPLNGRRILFDSAGGIRSRFALPYFSAIIGALGLTPDDFCFVAEPVWVDDVVVPEASFVELIECHQVFRDLCRLVATRIDVPEASLPPGSRVYLSKSRLSEGVWRFENEHELEHHLQRRGVHVVYPETLSIADQFALFNKDINLISTMGSALHNLSFGVAPASMVVLCRENEVVSNFSLIDDLVGAKPTYLFSPQARIIPDTQFSRSLFLENAPAVAEELFEESVLSGK